MAENNRGRAGAPPIHFLSPVADHGLGARATFRQRGTGILPVNPAAIPEAVPDVAHLRSSSPPCVGGTLKNHCSGAGREALWSWSAAACRRFAAPQSGARAPHSKAFGPSSEQCVKIAA